MRKILVCTITYKRPQGLQTLLKSLQSQIVEEGVSVEICVVDNACMDETATIIKSLQMSPYRIIHLDEEKKGIVYARNKAVQYFLSGDCEALVFIDDDEWTGNEYWLKNLLKAQSQTNADIVTGDVFSVPENESIEWTKKSMDRMRHVQNLEPVKHFYTGNVFLKRAVLEKVIPAFDDRFAMTGSSDLHFCLKCQKEGFKIVYTDTAPAFEIFPESRATIKWFFLRGFRNGSGATRSAIYTSDNIVKTISLCLFYAAARFARSIFVLSKALIKMDKGTYATGVMRFASSIGTVMGLFGVKYNEYKNIHGK